MPCTPTLLNILDRFHVDPSRALLFAALFVGTLVLSVAVAAFLFVRVPADYLLYRKPAHPQGPTWKWLVPKILKNLLGAVIVLVGIALSLPGVPGQGFLTILVGLMLVDLPWKRPFERWILHFPGVLNRINALRRRYGREPLVIPDHWKTKEAPGSGRL